MNLSAIMRDRYELINPRRAGDYVIYDLVVNRVYVLNGVLYSEAFDYVIENIRAIESHEMIKAMDKAGKSWQQ